MEAPSSLLHLPLLMWTYLTTFVLLDVLHSVRVSAPYAELVCHINGPGVQHLVKAFHITLPIGWQLTKG